MQAWIMHYYEDYERWILTSNIHLGFQTIIHLPLFELSPNSHNFLLPIEKEELMLVVDAYVHPRPYTLEQVEEINKTWNKFYD